MISGTRYQLRLETNRQLRLAGEIARAQAEISTGKKILAPSDDPAASARISDIGRSQANQKTWRSNLDKAMAIYAQADGVLKSLGNRASDEEIEDYLHRNVRALLTVLRENEIRAIHANHSVLMSVVIAENSSPSDRSGACGRARIWVPRPGTSTSQEG